MTTVQQPPVTQTEEQKRANRRLGLILASVAVAFAVGFMVKIAFLGR